MVSLDVLTMGRISVDVYPLQVGVSLREVESFGKYLGGSSTNVAVAAARYGRRAATITRTGADPFGEFLHDALKGFGVDDRYVTAGAAACPTPVAFCEIFPPDDFPLYFYRESRRRRTWRSAPDELDYDAIRAAKVFWVTVTGLSDEPSRSATLAALEARGEVRHHRCSTSTTARCSGSRARTAREWVGRALEHVDRRGRQPRRDRHRGRRARAARRRAGAARPRRRARGRQAGPEGRARRRRRRRAVEVPPVPVEVVNGLGAGDAFGGALCHGLLADWDLERMMRFCNAAGALVASRLACADAMPERVTRWRSCWGRMPDYDPADHAGGRGLGLLRPAHPAPGEAAFETGDDELIVLPLEGGAEVTVDGERSRCAGRDGVFAGPTDFVYAPRDARVEIAARRARRAAAPRARATAASRATSDEVADRAARRRPDEPPDQQLLRARTPTSPTA